MKTHSRVVGTLICLALLLAAFAGVAYAYDPPYPASDPFEPPNLSATVGGGYGEWDTIAPSADFFVELLRSGQIPQNGEPVFEGKSYLRYDQTQGILFVLVLMDPGIPILPTTNEFAALNDYMTSVKVDSVQVITDWSGNAGNSPNFEYITAAVDLNNDGDTADTVVFWVNNNNDGVHDPGEDVAIIEASCPVGFEASTYLSSGLHEISIVHTNVFDGGEAQTASTVKANPPFILVLPEYMLGGLLALGACFAAFVTYKKLPTFKHKRA